MTRKERELVKFDLLCDSLNKMGDGTYKTVVYEADALAIQV